MHDRRLLRHHLALARQVLDLRVLRERTVNQLHRFIQMLLSLWAVSFCCAGETHVRVDKERERPRCKFTVLAFEGLGNDALEELRRGVEFREAREYSGKATDGFPQGREAARTVGHAGGAHGDGEAARSLPAFVEDAGFVVEEFDLSVDVGLFLLGVLGEIFEDFECGFEVAFANKEFDAEEGEGEGEFDVGCALAS